MTTRTVTIYPDTPTYAGDGALDFTPHLGWTMEVTNKSATYLTDDYPALIRTGPSSLIAEQATYPSSTYTITGGPVYPATGETLYAGAHYAIANYNGVEYKVKWSTSVTTPTVVKDFFTAAGYIVA